MSQKILRDVIILVGSFSITLMVSMITAFVLLFSKVQMGAVLILLSVVLVSMIICNFKLMPKLADKILNRR